MKLENLGNAPEYVHKPRHASPEGIIETPILVLKMYDLQLSGINNPLDAARRFLNYEIDAGNIKPLIGLGFAILSSDMLNVSRWDNQYPIVVNNQIYTFGPNSKRPFESAKRASIDEVGPFCIWELGIVNHEKEAWKEYLASERSEQDKRKYLANMIIGEL